MCPNEFPSIMKGLSRGRRVHRGHRDMPPARPPVVTEAPLSPRWALWRGEDPPPPRQRPGRSASPTFYLGAWGGRGGPRTGRWLQSHRDGDVHREPGRRRSAGPSGVGRTRTPCGRGQTRGVFRGRRASSSSPPFPRGPAGGVSGRLRSPRHLNP